MYPLFAYFLKFHSSRNCYKSLKKSFPRATTGSLHQESSECAIDSDNRATTGSLHQESRESASDSDSDSSEEEYEPQEVNEENQNCCLAL